ncbi:MAG: hypothetical protein GX758_03280 [Tenericutes bacterium]|nr:hypothetical protein [Mycoplasmatota bacterium]
MEKKEATKKIPMRNYFIVLAVSIVVVVVSLYVRVFYLGYEKNKLNTSIFSEKVDQINLNDMNFALSETAEAILYVSYTGSSEINSMEKKLYKEIEKTGIAEKVIYLDVSEYKENLAYLSILKNTFKDIKDEINVAPMFIYIKDGKGIEAMSSELKLVDYNLFNKLVTKYEIE